MNWRPISYPKLSANAVATINALLSRDRPIEMANGDVGYSVRPRAALERFNTCMSLCIEVGGAAIDVHLSPATLEAVLTDLLPGKPSRNWTRTSSSRCSKPLWRTRSTP